MHIWKFLYTFVINYTIFLIIILFFLDTEVWFSFVRYKDQPWTVYHNETFLQKYKLENRTLYTETSINITTTPERLVKALRSDWGTIWNHHITENRVSSGETIEFDYFPTPLWGIIRIPRLHIVMHDVQKLKNDTWEIRGELYGDVQGHGKFVIRDLRNGRVELKECLVGERVSWYLTPMLVATRHMLDVRGELHFPWPRRTGWIQMIENLESGKL